MKQKEMKTISLISKQLYKEILNLPSTHELFLKYFSSLNTYWASITGFPDSSVGKESTCNARDPGSNSWVKKIPWRRDRLPTPVFMGFTCHSAGKESTCNLGDLGLIPRLGRSPEEGKGYPLQYSGLENSKPDIVLMLEMQIWLKSEDLLNDHCLMREKKNYNLGK